MTATTARRIDDDAPMTVIGVDVGGTFTDFVVYERDGSVRLLKRPTTIDDQSRGFADGLEELGIVGSAIDRLTHGTTTATNAVIERTGARCALVATRGFRDVLELGRRERPNLYGLDGGFVPLVPRESRLEIGGRLDHTGAEVEPLPEPELDQLVDELATLEVDAVAIALLHSYANSAHEERVEDRIHDSLPELAIARSSALYPERGEFARSSTTAIAAYVGPVVGRYFARVAAELEQRGHAGGFDVVQSNGGAMTHRTAIRLSHTTIKSGPAAGVVAAAAIAQENGVEGAISFDMGGTSADLAFVVDGHVARVVENSIGFRLPLHVPMLDITTVGAGGGSIARVDGGGVLQVGPASAGSTPGPACFGRGGTEPTVTDAHVQLGHVLLDSLRRNGVNRPSAAMAERSINDELAGRLGLSVSSAAEAILEVVNENMAGEIRLMTVDRGTDLRPLHLVAFGGAGPLHACALVRKLGMAGALVPTLPGLTSASGCLLSPLRHETTRMVGRQLGGLDDAELHELVRAQRVEGRAHLAAQGVAETATSQEVTISMLYDGQRHAIDVEVPHDSVDGDELRDAFSRRYEALYSATLDREPVVVAVRSMVSAPKPELELAALRAPVEDDRGAPDLPVEVKSHWRGEAISVDVRRRSDLASGDVVRGPALLVQLDSTILVEPDFDATVLPTGTLALRRRGQ